VTPEPFVTEFAPTEPLATEPDGTTPLATLPDGTTRLATEPTAAAAGTPVIELPLAKVVALPGIAVGDASFILLNPCTPRDD
jgi:hypothetical protein